MCCNEKTNVGVNFTPTFSEGFGNQNLVVSAPVEQPKVEPEKKSRIGFFWLIVLFLLFVSKKNRK